MAKIIVNNPRQVINGGAKKYYFKVKGLGGPKGDKGDKGDTGSQGPQGPQGNAATVSVGSTTTLPVGQDATVQNVGTLYNAVLNFGIPQGPRGPQGATGATGAKGDKGDQGNPGPQGEKGTNATVYIGTTSTLNPGSQATVYNSGTDSNAVLNFGIPKGEKGDTGPMPTIAQTTGQAADQVMSQKATTDALGAKQNTIDSSHKLSADMVDDTSSPNKFVTADEKATWSAKQNALTAGDNITISGDTISSTNTTYTAGDNITITGTTISTPAIAPEVAAELPTTGTEGKLYLTPKNYTTGTATGNPITATVAEDAGKIESFQLDGDTFQQSYTGKNLYNVEAIPYVPKRAYSSTGAELSWSDYTGTDEYQPVEPNTEYTLWNNKTSDTTYLCEYDENKNFIQRLVAVRTFTTTATTKYLRWSLSLGTGAGTTPPTQTQLELGSTATSYEPFVGGQPSPNPEYPQPIQTVTGEQTVTINSTAYPLDLGSIELCKLGTYQDYIWKDGDDWKVHKAMSKVIVDGKIGTISNPSANRFNLDNFITDYKKQEGSLLALCDRYISLGQAYNNAQFDTFASSYECCIDLGCGAANVIRFKNTKISTSSDFADALEANPLNLYYVLATATDTVITDQTLIAQLEAIRTASLENGTNTITNTATGSNLAGDMELGYYEYDPTNRYDKWLWLDINNDYEQIGS